MMPLAAGRKRLGLPWLGGTPSTLKALVSQRSKSTTANSEMGAKKKSTTVSQDGAHRYVTWDEMIANTFKRLEAFPGRMEECRARTARYVSLPHHFLQNERI